MKKCLDKHNHIVRFWKLAPVIFLFFTILLTLLPIEKILGVWFVSINMIWISIWIYCGMFKRTQKCIKWLELNNKSHYINDIALENPTLPKSKIYCGSKAFFYKKKWLIIPYDDIIWTYITRTNINGIAVEKLLVMYRRDGFKYQFHMRDNEISDLINMFLIPNSKDLVIGYGEEQRQQVSRVIKEYKLSKKIK